MSYVQITVWLRWKAGIQAAAVLTLLKVIINYLFNKIESFLLGFFTVIDIFAHIAMSDMCGWCYLLLLQSYDKKVEYGKHKKQFYTPALFSHSIPLKRRLRLCSQTP